jgi:hypothetical protein
MIPIAKTASEHGLCYLNQQTNHDQGEYVRTNWVMYGVVTVAEWTPTDRQTAYVVSYHGGWSIVHDVVKSEKTKLNIFCGIRWLTECMRWTLVNK